MGSLGPAVSLPDNPKAWSCSNLPATTNRKALTEQHISDLREILQTTDDGSVLLVPGDEGFEESLKRWSRAAEKRAGAVLHPQTAHTISQILPYATKHTLDLAIRCGGHSTAGASSTLGGLVIDLSSSMRSVTVCPTKRILTIQGGALWSDVDDAAWEHGLATVGGTVADTGVGGLTLGGGFGWLSGTHGLVIDNLVECEVVLADGRVLRASETENADLFWGLRGAGQNFGVVTEFVIQAWEQGNVWAGLLGFTTDKLEQVVGVLNEIVAPMKGRGMCVMAFGRPPPAGGQVLVIVPLLYDGTAEEGREGFKRLLDLGPLINTAESVPYNTVCRMLHIPQGKRVSMKGASFTLPLRAEFVETIMREYARFTEEVPDSNESLVAFELFDPGMISRVGNQDTSFANRGTQMNAMVGPIWENEADDRRARGWAREVAELFKVEMKRETQGEGDDKAKKDGGSVGVYGNYDQYDEKSRDVFGANYARLQELKAQYDPGNMFNKLFSVAPVMAA